MRVNYSEWAAPVVPVQRKMGPSGYVETIRSPINPHLQVDQYPLPKSADLFTCLTGGQSFTKLDLTHSSLPADDYMSM